MRLESLETVKLLLKHTSRRTSLEEKLRNVSQSVRLDRMAEHGKEADAVTQIVNSFSAAPLFDFILFQAVAELSEYDEFEALGTGTAVDAQAHFDASFNRLYTLFESQNFQDLLLRRLTTINHDLFVTEDLADESSSRSVDGGVAVGPRAAKPIDSQTYSVIGQRDLKKFMTP